MSERTRSLTARPTVYRGIHMRSRTEAGFAARLDRLGVNWAYEPECFADETRQYLPDFRVLDRGCAPTYIEVKGVLSMAEVEPLQRRMEVIWASEPTAHLFIAILSTGDVYLSNEDGEWYHQNPSYWGAE